MKQIIIAGAAVEELPIYLSTILNNGGHKTAIIDRSKDAVGCHTLICMLDDADENGNYATSAERGSVKVYTDKARLSDEEFVVDFYGENIADIDVANAEEVILGTDMNAFNARKLAKIAPVISEPDTEKEDASGSPGVGKTKKKKKDKGGSQKNEKVFLFINDYASLKYGEKYVQTVSHHPEALIVKHPYNTADLAVKLSIGYEKIDITKLSSEYKAILSYFYYKLTQDVENKKLTKLLWR